MNTKETLYNTYVHSQRNNPEKIALYTRDGEQITHGRLLTEIDKVAAGLLAYKTGETLKVGIVSSSSYEEAVFLLASSKIGAVTKFIDFTKNVTEIGESIAESSINILVIGAEFLSMEPVVNPFEMPVIVLGAVPEKSTHYISYVELLNKETDSAIKPVPYCENHCAVIINSSGTTGTPKPIELSDRAINAAVEKMRNTDYPLYEKNLLLKIIPSQIGMGLITSLYTGLIIGIPVIYLGGNNPKESIELFIGLLNGFHAFLKKNHLQKDTKLLIFGSPMYFRTLYQFYDCLVDLSFIGCMLAGGSAMSKEELEIIDRAFAAKGCSVPILNGYGQNEMAGAVTLNQNSQNRRGSAGKVVTETELKIIDITTGRQLQKNNIGKIYERSDSLFLQYENMPDETKASFITDNDGLSWFNTNDIGYLDDDGFLFITGRTSRIIIRFDMKVSLDKMEEKIRGSKYIKEVGVVSLKHESQDETFAFVVLADDYSKNDIFPKLIVDDIQQSRNPLNELEIVDRIVIADALPYRSSGKIDYRALEKIAEEMRKS